MFVYFENVLRSSKELLYNTTLIHSLPSYVHTSPLVFFLLNFFFITDFSLFFPWRSLCHVSRVVLFWLFIQRKNMVFSLPIVTEALSLMWRIMFCMKNATGDGKQLSKHSWKWWQHYLIHLSLRVCFDNEKHTIIEKKRNKILNIVFLWHIF